MVFFGGGDLSLCQRYRFLFRPNNIFIQTQYSLGLAPAVAGLLERIGDFVYSCGYIFCGKSLVKSAVSPGAVGINPVFFGYCYLLCFIGTL